MKISGKDFRIRVITLIAAIWLCAAPATPLLAVPKSFAYLDGGRTYVPLRLLGEYAGASVSWHPEEQRVVLTKDGVEIVLYAGRTGAVVDGETVPLDAPPFLRDGVTYVPLGFAGRALGLSIEWQQDAGAVRIASGDGEFRLPVVPLDSIRKDDPPIVHETREFKVGNKRIKAQTVTIALMDPRVELDVVVAGGEAGRTEELSAMAKRHGAMVAINGAFFDAYTESEIKKPYGWLLNDGEVLNRGDSFRRATFIYDRNHLAEIADGLDMPELIRADGIDGAVQAGPRLVRNGKVDLDVEGEGFKDPKILTNSGARSALGITRDHRLILVTVPAATIPQLAEIMLQAGAWQAMNLDGGASSGLYYNGKYLTKPGRLLSNALIVKLES